MRHTFPSKFIPTVSCVGAVSAPLGVLLDNQHGLFGVLSYNEAASPLSLTGSDGHVWLKTAIFVPFLFAFAGAAMSSIILYLDSLKGSTSTPPPSLPVTSRWPKVFYGISAFSGQYWLSGYLDAIGSFDPLQINIILSILAIAGFLFFDNTFAGLVLAILTALTGPVVEILLVKLGLYNYTHSDILGIDSWIPSVYFLGGPAVGNLARAVQAQFIEGSSQRQDDA